MNIDTATVSFDKKGISDTFMKNPIDGDKGLSLPDDIALLLNRVIHASVTNIVVTDPRLPGSPIVYHNPARSSGRIVAFFKV
ncbi:MAG: hypothetical protein EOO38_19525 [Cytophagaceae bacterium]|nr:MAG: hypothetical protein EOO38_19525 [Cytophagaceae bacterium]